MREDDLWLKLTGETTGHFITALQFWGDSKKDYEEAIRYFNERLRSQLQSVFEEIKTQHLIDTDCVEKFGKLRQKYLEVKEKK